MMKHAQAALTLMHRGLIYVASCIIIMYVLEPSRSPPCV
jgi:hypothetical protein